MPESLGLFEEKPSSHGSRSSASLGALDDSPWGGLRPRGWLAQVRISSTLTPLGSSSALYERMTPRSPHSASALDTSDSELGTATASTPVNWTAARRMATLSFMFAILEGKLSVSA